MRKLRKASWKSTFGSVTLTIFLVLLFTPIHVYGAADVIRQGPGDERNVALTFDDGYAGEFTAQVLDILSEYDVQATFFLNGEAMHDHPDLTRRVVEEGTSWPITLIPIGILQDSPRRRFSKRSV